MSARTTRTRPVATGDARRRAAAARVLAGLDAVVPPGAAHQHARRIGSGDRDGDRGRAPARERPWASTTWWARPRTRSGRQPREGRTTTRPPKPSRRRRARQDRGLGGRQGQSVSRQQEPLPLRWRSRDSSRRGQRTLPQHHGDRVGKALRQRPRGDAPRRLPPSGPRAACRADRTPGGPCRRARCAAPRRARPPGHAACPRPAPGTPSRCSSCATCGTTTRSPLGAAEPALGDGLQDHRAAGFPLGQPAAR